MYITYCRNQQTVDISDRTNFRLNLTGGDYRPTWLIRVSDWEKVPGKAAVDGYHTISYCWEQSGEVVKNETDDEYSLVDNGKHCIVEGYNLYEDEIIRPADFFDTGEDCKNDSDSDEQKEPKNYNEYTLWCEPKSETASIRYVTYDQLLQQVCKDFQVEYVWYDKVCIDQSDKKAKLREIKQMHKIYRNARYTIAMIPEVRIYDRKDFEHKIHDRGHRAQEKLIDDVWFSSWFKRSWTLEEVMMARRILIVGADVNMFQHSLNTTDVPTTLDFLSHTLLDFGGTERDRSSVNQALAFAHFRTSTKAHDMIFALKNTFSYMFDDIEASYSTDIKTTFNDFYRHVATEDLSILCFASLLYLDGLSYQENTMHNYNLPSWTGVAGCHAKGRITTTTHPQLKYHIDDTMWMHLTTKHYWTISITPYDHGCYSSPRNSTEESNSYVQNIDFVNSNRSNGIWIDMTTAGEDVVLLEWLTSINNITGCYMTHYHQPQGGLRTQLRPLTLTEDCEECIILPILLNIHTAVYEPADGDIGNFIIEIFGKNYCLPVLRECTKGSGRYRAIGVYYIGSGDENLLDPTLKWSHSIGRDDIHTDDPEEVLNILFENYDHDVPKEFIIE